MQISIFMSVIITYICILLAVAFFTLLERKGLGYFQIRKGPNKVSLMGLPQPLADAVKLFTKELVKPTLANKMPYFMAPMISLFLSLLLWQLYPLDNSCGYFLWGMLFFLCVSSLNVYSLLLAGWASNSKYALIGAIRAVAQTISYEVSLALILLFVLFISKSFSLIEIKSSFDYVWLCFLFIPISMIWVVSCIAETNRAPFDFAEGESELVSGFNIEYGSGGFALIFMAEYANILFMSLLIALLFFGGDDTFVNSDKPLVGDLAMSLKVLFFSFLFIWIRATYPRFRYDKLMSLTWKSFLPFSLCCLMLVSGILWLMNLFSESAFIS